MIQFVSQSEPTNTIHVTYVQGTICHKSKMAILHWLHICKKKLSISSPNRNFFYSLIMKALKSTNEIYFIKRQFLVPIYHASYDLLWFLQYLFHLWLTGKFHLVNWLSRSSIWLLAELLPNAFLHQKRKKNVCLKELFYSSVSWDCREFFWARFKKVFGLVIRTFPSLDHKSTLWLDTCIYRIQYWTKICFTLWRCLSFCFSSSLQICSFM